ncbi:MAG: deoxyguanosinetriphosphate triphosphohydrolase [Paludibacter sp.]|nr:deoxyguanosinetriphosphate triphosphohydrolase [Bacteroidales bacterium]MCM1068570.1 deoxyguanosinetriphosphate triphosphohydrolase [Prevotella sp.]MCM1353234.1 deoxyguanosinetriphosphate triphosphohydrolase [Bacteroides sp.]MCM1442358.1 deoxyguanosinetriphosphate triphosphohydrolase [Muribaculum sp.]MCM1481177.1 deoxyguanosinetriphosphate triphosphohydrolase [Paludibacter sp.]
MNWEQLITTIRFGQEGIYNPALGHDARNEFQRDYDRLIFSAPFRRMQNKTQVFPLPGSVFVHNRLTHSLEVSCVGRSLGNRVADSLKERHSDCAKMLDSIGEIVSAACLAHDMGNPPFGHSGEQAIDTYFSEGNGKKWQTELTEEQWADCIRFEGNANAFRILTHQFKGRRSGGFVLTYSTLASVVKYPYAAISSPNPKGKFGFFDSDKDSWERIAMRLGIVQRSDGTYARFPLVYLVEAADDICYQIMDIEDAHKLRLLSTDETKELLFGFFDEKRKERICHTMDMVQDTNEQIAYLRSCVIGNLVDACTDVFLSNEEQIMDGTFEGSLIKHIHSRSREAYKQCSEVSVKRIYRSNDVLDVELAGYKIIYMLMEELIQAVFNADKAYSRQLLQRVPSQYAIDALTPYGKIQAMLDYVSGMTDVYALDLYQKITGASLPMV